MCDLGYVCLPLRIDSNDPCTVEVSFAAFVTKAQSCPNFSTRGACPVPPSFGRPGLTVEQGRLHSTVTRTGGVQLLVPVRTTLAKIQKLAAFRRRGDIRGIVHYQDCCYAGLFLPSIKGDFGMLRAPSDVSMRFYHIFMGDHGEMDNLCIRPVVKR